MTARMALLPRRRALAWILLLPSLAWGIGIVASDRWWWSQWLLWIPAPVPLACAAAAVAIAWRRERHGSAMLNAARAWRGLAALRLLAVAAAAATAVATLRWVSWGRSADAASPPPPAAISIVHLNARWPADGTELAAALLSHQALVHAISESGALLRAPAVRAAAQAGAVTLQVGRFAIVSRCPVLEARAVYDDGSIAASWIRFGPTNQVPGWSMLMVDAPRRLRTSRDDIFRRLRVALDGMSIGPPDVVIGDLNTTPGSFAVASAWPGFADSSEVAGRGLRATFPREFPIWAIDRCLVTPRWRAKSWSAWDPGLGAHRGQRVVIDPRPVTP